MTRHRVLVTDYAWPDLDLEREVLGAAGAELVVAERGEETELVSLAGDVSGILTCWKRVTTAVLDAAPSCVTVARYGVGLDNIDVARADALGMVVTRVPDYCVEEVADHTMALLLACARRVVAFDRAVAGGTWDNTSSGDVRRLRGRTLAVVGYGAIGRAVALRAAAFGLRVVAVTRRPSDRAVGDGVQSTTDLDAALAESDYVSLHVPLDPSTRHLIDERRLRSMRRDAYLVNTARGPLVDETALRRAVDERWIAGAALDVLDGEPAGADHPLVGVDGIIVTPHAAFYSQESVRQLARTAAQNVAAVLTGSLPAPLYVVNPDVVETSRSRVRING